MISENRTLTFSHVIKSRFAPLIILLSGIALYYVLIATRPTPVKTQKTQQPLLVEVMRAEKTSETANIEALGIVKPAIEIPLQSRVNGEIIEVHKNFVPGGIFTKGETILKLDPSDFALLLNQRISELETAKANLQIEQGNQVIAEAEYKLLSETLTDSDLSLVLRRPQINIMRAQVKAAEAAVERAKLDLERTTITAPFNGTITERSVELGAQVSPGTTFGTFVGTDTYWVEAKIPLEQFKWIALPNEESSGSKVQIFNPDSWKSTQHIDGVLSHVSKNLEDSGRLLTLYIEINAPLEAFNTKDFQLFLNSYVRLHIQGNELKDVVALSREHLRSDTTVWIMNTSGTLEVREVESGFRTRDRIYIVSGIESGDLIITSDITAPVPNMPLRTNDGSILSPQVQSSEF
jgi:RND family efflux transporter MFP subunit